MVEKMAKSCAERHRERILCGERIFTMVGEIWTQRMSPLEASETLSIFLGFVPLSSLMFTPLNLEKLVIYYIRCVTCAVLPLLSCHILLLLSILW